MKRNLLTTIFLTCLIFCGLTVPSLGQTYHNLSSGKLSFDWTDITLITANDAWTGIPSIRGFLGDDATGSITAVDPQTIVVDNATLDVIANLTAPNTSTSGGVAEVEITDPTIAFQGSGTADFPNIIVYVNATGVSNIKVDYDLRDIDESTDNAIQQVALQYRIGTTGNFTNIPEGYVADASTGPSLATLVTHVGVTLPAECNNQSEVQIRIITTNAASSDEWIGIDNIQVGPDTQAPITTIVPADASTDVAINVVPTITFDEAARNTDASEITDANLTSIIKFKKTNSIGEDVPCTMTIDAAKKVITITPTATLDNSQLYYIECGEVEDASGNTGVVKSSTFTTISATAPVLTLTAPLGGETFYAGQDVTFTWTSANVTNVKIEVYIPGDGIYSEITASTPAAAGTYAYKVPAEAAYSAAYKIKISDVANPTTCVDESQVFTVIGVATSISDLRSRFAVNDVVKLNSEAIITYINGKNYYVQDAGAGVLVYDNTLKLTTTYAQYDGVTGFIGTLSNYNGVLELVPTTDAGAPTSTANTVTPLEVNIVSLNSDPNTYESRLLKIIGVTFADGGGTFAKTVSYNFTDGVNTAIFRTTYTTDYIGTVVPKKADIVCLGMDYNGTAQVVCRSLADFTVYSSAKAITAFAFNGLTPAVVGTVDETAKTVALTVPAGTVVNALVPTITVSDKATVAPLSGVATDFTNAVTYTVTAEDGTTQAYAVTVTILTGVDKNAEAVIAIGPVPAKTCLNISNIESVKLIEIFNVAGIKIETVRCEGISNLPLSVEKYKSGYYFIRFTTSDGVFMKKFIKQ